MIARHCHTNTPTHHHRHLYITYIVHCHHNHKTHIGGLAWAACTRGPAGSRCCCVYGHFGRLAYATHDLRVYLVLFSVCSGREHTFAFARSPHHTTHIHRHASYLVYAEVAHAGYVCRTLAKGLHKSHPWNPRASLQRLACVPPRCLLSRFS